MLKLFGFKLIMFLADILPRSLQYWIAHRVADAHYWLDRPARLAVKANLRVILGEQTSEKTIRNEARWVFRSFGMYLCEFFGHRRFGPDFIDQHVIVQGQEHLDAALKKGHGAIFCSGHYSNWELGGTIVTHLGYPLLAVVQKHSDPRVNAMFLKQREDKGIHVVHSQQGATAALKALRKNETAVLLGDRTTGGPVIDVIMFGRRTSLPQGPWRIALTTGAALLPTFMVRRFNNQYTLEIGAPIYAPTEGTREERMTAMAQAWVKCFETRLRADPSQWAAFYHVWNTPSTLERQSQSLILEKINVVASTTDDKVGFFEE